MNDRETETPKLKREAIVRAEPPPQTRHAGILVLTSMALASLAVLVIVPMVHLSISHQRPTSVVVTTTVESPVAPQSAAAVVTVRPAPARDLAIGEPLAAGKTLTSDPGVWIGTAASPGPYGVLAVWSSSHLFVSRDDGVGFRQVLGGPGSIGGATIDESGRLFMIRDRRRLGIENTDGSTQWLSLPFSGETLALQSSGGWLGWLALAHDTDSDSAVVLALSSDGGATWRRQSVAEHATHALMRIEPGGVIHLLLRVEDSIDQKMWRLRAHVDGRPMESMPWPSQYADAWGLARGGWAYAIASECATDSNDICAMGPDPADRIVNTEIKTTWNLIMESNSSTTLAASGSSLLRFDGARITRVTDDVPPEVTSFAVDGIDRSLAVVGQHLLRFSPEHGWRIIFSRDGEIHYRD